MEVLTDQSRQLKCWVEHYLKLCATQNEVPDAAMEALPHLSVMEQPDTVPTADEVSNAINCLTSGKAPGKDGTPPKVLKSGKSALLQHLHELLCLCWQKGYIPHDIQDANIITLYKNKGDCSKLTPIVASPF